MVKLSFTLTNQVCWNEKGAEAFADFTFRLSSVETGGGILWRSVEICEDESGISGGIFCISRVRYLPSGGQISIAYCVVTFT